MTWPVWLQTALIAIMLLAAVLAWFTIDWGALLVLAAGVLFAIYFRGKNSN